MRTDSKEFEVRETDPRDETPDLVELVFRTVYGPHQSISNVERLTRGELAEVRDTISAYLDGQPKVIADSALHVQTVAELTASAV